MMTPVRMMFRFLPSPRKPYDGTQHAVPDLIQFVLISFRSKVLCTAWQLSGTRNWDFDLEYRQFRF